MLIFHNYVNVYQRVTSQTHSIACLTMLSTWDLTSPSTGHSSTSPFFPVPQWGIPGFPFFVCWNSQFFFGPKKWWSPGQVPRVARLGQLDPLQTLWRFLQGRGLRGGSVPGDASHRGGREPSQRGAGDLRWPQCLGSVSRDGRPSRDGVPQPWVFWRCFWGEMICHEILWIFMG